MGSWERVEEEEAGREGSNEKYISQKKTIKKDEKIPQCNYVLKFLF